MVLENNFFLCLPIIHFPGRSLSHIPRNYTNRWLHKALEQQMKFPFVDFELDLKNFSCTWPLSLFFYSSYNTGDDDLDFPFLRDHNLVHGHCCRSGTTLIGGQEGGGIELSRVRKKENHFCRVLQTHPPTSETKHLRQWSFTSWFSKVLIHT